MTGKTAVLELQLINVFSFGEVSDYSISDTPYSVSTIGET